MGLFSRPKCPIHGIPYSIGTNGLEDYYYCKECKHKAAKDRNARLQINAEMLELKKKVLELEQKLTT